MNSKLSVYDNKNLAQRVKLLIYDDICWLPYYISQLMIQGIVKEKKDTKIERLKYLPP